MNQFETNKIFPVVCFGEILWDLLPGCAVPGGAPMNVAYHLKKLNVDPALITKVGMDEWGENLLNLMKVNHIHTDFFQMDGFLETGKVNAHICANNEMSYDILQPVAWDQIEWNKEIENLVSNSEFFVYGSLAARTMESRITLYQLIESANKKVVDVNLRPPHYSRDIIEKLLLDAYLLKLNLSELELIAGWISEYSSQKEKIQLLQDSFRIENIVVTKGGDGAILNVGGTFYEHPGYHVIVKDTVGSGDAFLAALLSQFLSKKNPSEALEFACGLGALIATYTGACPEYQTEEIRKIIIENSIIF